MRPPPRPGRAPRTRAALLTLYAHPFELATAVLLGVSAVRSGLDPETLAPILTPGLTAIWVIANTLGIVGIVAGLFGSADLTGEQPQRRAFYRALEKAGLYLAASTTGAVTIAVLVQLPASQAWDPATQLAAITAACLLRAGAVRKAERIELDQLRKLNASDYLANLLTGDDDGEGER